MEFIKKTILQSLTTGTTATTEGIKYIIIPDLTAIYHMKIGLESTVDDIGFFDAYDSMEVVTGNTATTTTTTLEPTITTTTTLEPITGTTTTIEPTTTLEPTTTTTTLEPISGTTTIEPTTTTTIEPITNAYYVSNTGNDSNLGTSPEFPWRTIDKVNSVSIEAGYSVLFKRGDSFFGSITSSSGDLSGDVTYGAYGSGTKPMLHISTLANSTDDWIEVDTNIWETASYIEFSHDVGNVIFNDSTTCGVKYPNTTDLTIQGDFMFDFSIDRMRMYSNGNPANYYSDIRLLHGNYIFNESNENYITYENLWLNYCGGYGIAGGNTHHITIRDCDFSWLGGKYLVGYGDGTVRCGNGVEFWAASHDNLVEGCKLWEIYDAALTNQGAATTTGNQTNIIYKNNIVWNCEYSFEYFYHNNESEVDNIQFINNTCYNAGYGWGNSQRSDPSGRHVCAWAVNSNVTNMIIENNIFCEAKNSIIYIDNGTLSELTVNYNCYQQSSGRIANLPSNNNFEYNEFNEYLSYSGLDSNSLNTDPLFLDAENEDFSLNPLSPCIDNGNPNYPLDPDNTVIDIGGIYYQQ